MWRLNEKKIVTFPWTLHNPIKSHSAPIQLKQITEPIYERRFKNPSNIWQPTVLRKIAKMPFTERRCIIAKSCEIFLQATLAQQQRWECFGVVGFYGTTHINVWRKKTSEWWEDFIKSKAEGFFVDFLWVSWRIASSETAERFPRE